MDAKPLRQRRGTEVRDVRLGAGKMQPLQTLSITPSGHAMQARIYAEDPGAGFRPSTGLLTYVGFAQGVRVDKGDEAFLRPECDDSFRREVRAK